MFAGVLVWALGGLPCPAGELKWPAGELAWLSGGRCPEALPGTSGAVGGRGAAKRGGDGCSGAIPATSIASIEAATPANSRRAEVRITPPLALGGRL